jgi:hypothetical protein
MNITILIISVITTMTMLNDIQFSRHHLAWQGGPDIIANIANIPTLLCGQCQQW